jgi:hypothetical protein
MYGCYEALSGGQLPDALVEVSGGVPENINLTQSRDQPDTESARLFQDLLSMHEKKDLIVCAIRVRASGTRIS